MSKIRISAVSYLNTKPFLYGLLNSSLKDIIDIKLDVPSECVNKLMQGEADIALMPVAGLKDLDNPFVFSDFCIGADGPVHTVGIFSDCPIEEVKTLCLDKHSRTSVELAKILLKEFWGISPDFVKNSEGVQRKIRLRQASLAIGDKTIDLHHNHPYFYDLGEIWKKFTGLPFVFAVWVSSKPLAPEFVKEFNTALKYGLDNLDHLLHLIPQKFEKFDLSEYFDKYISYDFDEDKKKAMLLFLQKMNHPATAQ